MKEAEKRGVLNPADMSSNPVTLETAVLLVFVEIAGVATAVVSIIAKSFDLFNDGRSLLMLVLGAETLVLFAFWLILRKMVFGRLATIVSIVQARNQFLSGRRRGQTASAPDPQSASSRIVVLRRLDVPRIPKEFISSDQVGMIAALIENEYLRQRRFEGLVRDVFESNPDAMVAIGENGLIYQANRPLLDLYGITESEFFAPTTGSRIEDTLTGRLHLAPALVDNIIAILRQNAPRIAFREFETTRKLGHRDLLISVSALTFQGQRIAVIVIHNQRLRGQLIPWNLVADFGVQQLEKLDRIYEKVYSDSLIDTHSTAWAEVVVTLGNIRDSINAVLEISHAMTSRTNYEVEFDLIRLLNSLMEAMDVKQQAKIVVEEGFHPIVFGSPNHLRSFMTSLLSEFKTINSGEFVVSVNQQRGGVLLTLRCPARSKAVRRSRSSHVLCTMAKFFGFQPLPVDWRNRTDFFAFTLASRQSDEVHPKLLPWQRIDGLLNKRLAVVQTETVVEQQTIRVLQGIKSQHTAWFDLNHFSSGNQNPAAFDALIVLVGRPRWSEIADLNAVVNRARKAGVPALVISRTPRRGESEDASKLGFAAYLSYPISRHEVEKALLVITNPEVLTITRTRGILTRHVVREMTESVGVALVSEFDDGDSETADSLCRTLEGIGFEVVRTRTQSAFFSTLFQRDFDFVFSPSRLSSGLQRQILLVLRGRPTLCYLVPRDETSTEEQATLGPLIQNVSSAPEVIDSLGLVGRRERRPLEQSASERAS